MLDPVRALFLGTAVATLAACGGGDNPFTQNFRAGAPLGPISSDEAALIAENFDALNSRVLAIPETPDGVMPTAGQATFTGLSQIVVTPRTGSTSMTLTGDTTVNANFGGPFLTVQMDSFAGADLTGATVRLDGELRVDDARIGSTGGVSNQVTGTFRGILLGSKLEIEAGGAFEGTFHGVPTAAMSFSGVDNSATYNSEAATITLSGIAEE